MRPLHEFDARTIVGIFTDLDDTLTTDGRLSATVLAALERLTGQDHRWNLAGWREWLGARDTAAPIDLRRSLPAGAAAEGGAGDAAAPRGTHGRR